MQETFGKYRLIERLAFGGMAEVFLATVHGEAGFSKPVVIKRLHPRLSEDREFTQMLIDEARITARLTHTNICQVLDLGAVDDDYFIAMEYVAGEDLRAFQNYFRRRKEHMPVEAAVFVVAELLAGLDYAHRQRDEDGQPLGVIHRDISPQNTLISYEGEVKIIDFGIAKARQRLVQTQAGVIKGKFRYMSPEQASGGTIDHRTDVFAAGVVLYELLRGEPHSLHLRDTEVLRRMREAEFDPIERSPEEVPDALLDVVSRALQRSRRKRFSTAAEFRQELLKSLPHRVDASGRPQGAFGRPELADLMATAFPPTRRRQAGKGGSGRKDRPVERERITEAPRDPSAETGKVSAGVAAQPNPASYELRSGVVSDAPSVADSGRLPRVATTPIQTGEDAPVRRASARDGGPSDESRMETSQRENVGPVSDSEAASWGGPWNDPAIGPDSQVYDEPGGAMTRVREQRPPAVLSRSDDEDAAATRQRARPRRYGGQQAGAFTHGVVGRAAPANQAGGGYSSTSERAKVSHHPGLVSAPAARLGAPQSQGQAGGERTAIDSRRGPTDGGAEASRADRVVGLVFLFAVLMGAAFYAGHHLWSKPSGDEHRHGPLAPDASDEAGRQSAEHGRQRLRNRIGHILVRSRPPGAEIVLCGRQTGQRTPATVSIRAGKTCKLELWLAGRVSYELPVSVEAGQRMTVQAKLRAPDDGHDAREARGGVLPARSIGSLVVTAIRVGTVYVNGRAVGQTPRLSLELAPGRYAVKVHFATLGVQTGARVVTIKRGKQVKLHFDPAM